jgi:DNA adenine methylase
LKYQFLDPKAHGNSEEGKAWNKFKDSIIVVSYSSNSLPSLDQMVALLSKYKKVEVVQIDHKYSFGNQNHKIENNKNTVKEYLFIGY